MTSGSTSRPSNEITGIKKRSSVLVRGMSHMEIAKAIGAIPQGYTEPQYVEWAKGARGYSTFELWQQIPGNELLTLTDFFNYLGFTQAAQEAAIIAQIAASQAASAASAAAGAASAAASAGSAAASAASAAAAAASAASIGPVNEFLLASAILSLSR